MKKQIKLLFVVSFFPMFLTGQLNPTGGNSNPNNDPAWSRAGNNQGAGGNLFGTRYNSPIYFITGGGLADNRRMKLNGSFGLFAAPQYSINGYGAGQGVNSTGYLLLGQNMNSAGGNIYTDLGAFSMLHLNGRDQPGAQEAGYRPWMKTGVTFTDNNDLSYIGLRKLGTGLDRTETVIAWSDNAGTGFGPDDMVFRFTSGGQGNTTVSTDLTTSEDLDGRHIARFAPTGEFGLGNTFGVNVGGPAIYVRPQSLLHLSLNDGTSVWAQWTNQTSGQTANNGLRIGMLGHGNAQVNGNALVYQQDNRHLLFSTNANAGNVSPTATRERMRITAVSAPTALPGGGYGNYNPGGIIGNRTRVAISHDPDNPVTRPLSLLHLGYNVGSPLLPGSLDGWRDWMDVGMFVAQGTDNIYVGLKPEGNDRFDAVINWGDNQGASINGPVGPDYLRFIFTSSATSIPPGDPVSGGNHGLETGRFEPTEDVNGLPNSYGKFGVGDFYTTPTEVTHKLHVRGNGRFEYIPEDAAEHIILGKEIDPNNPDDVSFRRLAFTNDPNDVLLGDGTWGTVTGVGGVLGAHNGTSMSTINPDLVAFGQDVGDPTNPGVLLSDREIPMDGFDIQFNGIGTQNANLVSFGQPNSITGYDDSKLHVYNDHENVAISGYTDAAGLPPFFSRQFGVSGYITNASSDISAAVHGLAENSAPGMQGTGVFGEAQNNAFNIGVRGNVFDDNAQINYGGNFGAVGTAQINYGIFASAFGATGVDYSGFFVGDVYIGGATLGPSDINLKDNVNQLTNATSIINQLEAVTFDFKQNGQYERLNLPDVNQFGLIAQDVEQILPELVSDVVAPAVYDSLGTEVYPSITYKGLNYKAFTPILIQGFQEQQLVIDSLSIELASKDSIINDINDRLTQLENCLSNILPLLCQINNSAIYQNDDNAQNQLIHSLNLELFDGENIVLEQNIPNPFAERTVINYYLPESVGDAKIIFYNQEGRMINEVKINERGNGRINVFGADLSRGIYSYTLICDGQVIATKKMVKQ